MKKIQISKIGFIRIPISKIRFTRKNIIKLTLIMNMNMNMIKTFNIMNLRGVLGVTFLPVFSVLYLLRVRSYIACFSLSYICFLYMIIVAEFVLAPFGHADST